MTTDPRFPIGKAVLEPSLSPEKRLQHIEMLASTPAKLRAAVKGLTPQQLDTPYREGGWTVRQVIHHLPDSHMNAFIRTKLALTEDNPTIKAYDEDAFAKLGDITVPVEVSLQLLENLHQRWDVLLRAMAPADFARTFDHPERGPLTLDLNLCIYAWHGPHHVAHITALKDRMGWK
ncbi:MAG TPA: bacillithiol transferase BstA [Terriglobales bacterium]|nr:bacillithiol transferase BstA [Terriglobales bacterium]